MAKSSISTRRRRVLELRAVGAFSALMLAFIACRSPSDPSRESPFRADAGPSREDPEVQPNSGKPIGPVARVTAPPDVPSTGGGGAFPGPGNAGSANAGFGGTRIGAADGKARF